jgi:hypothetical protein
MPKAICQCTTAGYYQSYYIGVIKLKSDKRANKSLIRHNVSQIVNDAAGAPFHMHRRDAIRYVQRLSSF